MKAEDYPNHKCIRDGPFIDSEVVAATALLPGSKKYESSSQYYGVFKHKPTDKFLVNVSLRGRKQHCGYYSNEVEAAKAYDSVASLLSNKELNFGMCVYLFSTTNICRCIALIYIHTSQISPFNY
jgi:hypothetical protein